MNTVYEIDAAVQRLPVGKALELQDWLAGHLEDAAELTPEFIARIEHGKTDLPENRTHVSQP